MGAVDPLLKAVDEKYVLASDVIIAPVASLPPRVRAGLGTMQDGFAVTRPRARTPSTIVDGQGAALLERFREEIRIVDAVRAYSEGADADPREVLAQAFPILERLRSVNFLVPAGSPAAGRIRPTLSFEDRVDAFEILRALQVAEDAEVYQARDDSGRIVVLKIARPDTGEPVRRLLDREAEALARMGGAFAPELLTRGSLDGSPYLAMEWIPGARAGVVARELRDPAGSRSELARLCASIARAYEALHRAGVIHADVQPDNVLVDEAGRVTLVDFAFSRLIGGRNGRAVREGRVACHMSPEDAAVRRGGGQALEPGRSGEQYAVATLLYRLITGEPYLELALDEERCLAQILEDEPLPFSRRGTPPWSEMEAVLRRALSKRSEDRFPAMRSFRAALERVADATSSGSAAPATTSPRLDELLERVLDDLRLEGRLFERGPPEAPTCSVTFGRAGIAWMLYRYAIVRMDGRALACAEAWITRALQCADEEGAFLNPDYSITGDNVGPASPYHCLAGVHCVRALIANAMGDGHGRKEATLAFIDRSRETGPGLDLTLGMAGTLLAASSLLEGWTDPSAATPAALRALGDAVCGTLWEALDGAGPVETSRVVPDRAMAHGWAGMLYATMRWCRAAGVDLPNRLEGRLAELAGCAEGDGRGVRWRIVERIDDTTHTHGFGTSWCNGTSGFTYLWTLAADCMDDPAYLGLAERTAWNVWEGGGDILNLCCGLGGRAYALLHIYKATGDSRWLARARQIADRAGLVHSRFADANPRPFPHSLYKGDPGLALLAAELDRPERSCMPFFEDEGWGARGAMP